MTSDRYEVVGFGATSIDYVYRLPQPPAIDGPNAKMRISGHERSPGGQTATALVTCARLGLKTGFIGVIGSDDNGRRIRDEMRSYAVDVTHAIVRDCPNQFAAILVDDSSGERIVLWDRDAQLAARPREIRDAAFNGARVLHVDDVDQEAAIEIAVRARAAGLQVTSDIDRVNDRTEALMAAVSIVIFAEHVPAALTGDSDPEAALRKLRRSHAGPLVVTLGARGAMILDGDEIHAHRGFTVDSVDTTGAGDVFRGAYIYGMLKGWPHLDTLRFANAAAALSCTRAGAIRGVPTLREVQTFLTEMAAE
jgi:sugar/nucleoside kinase (ribokinase family)